MPGIADPAYYATYTIDDIHAILCIALKHSAPHAVVLITDSEFLAVFGNVRDMLRYQNGLKLPRSSYLEYAKPSTTEALTRITCECLDWLCTHDWFDAPPPEEEA
jgi:hypothetical protein